MKHRKKFKQIHFKNKNRYKKFVFEFKLPEKEFLTAIARPKGKRRTAEFFSVLNTLQNLLKKPMKIYTPK